MIPHPWTPTLRKPLSGDTINQLGQFHDLINLALIASTMFSLVGFQDTVWKVDGAIAWDVCMF